jgi:dTDP-glucose 4,6-dehydratase
MLVTGGSGFIGVNFIRLVLASEPEVKVLNFDALTYAGNPHAFADLPAEEQSRYQFVRGDIRERPDVLAAFTSFQPEAVVNFAAESHVDRSIDNPLAFVETNVLGTANLLHLAREFSQKGSPVHFHHVSTDEVYGSLGDSGSFREDSLYDPSSPYAASKAASDHLVQAWHRTYGLRTTLSNCSNNYGPWQFPEKLIPLVLGNAIAGKPIPVYGDGGNIRDWLHVEDHARAILTILRLGRPGACYNVGGRGELSNLNLVQRLCDILQELSPLPDRHYRDLITFVPDRPGHDRRYAIDPGRIETELGWKAGHSLDSGLRDTVLWYLSHQDWLRTIQQEVYDGRRLGGGSATPPRSPAAG